MENKYAILGIILGTLALFFAISQIKIAIALDYLFSQSFNSDQILPYPDLDTYGLTCFMEKVSALACRSAQVITLTIALIGFILSLISFIRKEHGLRSLEAMGTSIVALVWNLNPWGLVLTTVWIIVWLNVKFSRKLA